MLRNSGKQNRKLQTTGKTSYMVSLPREWVADMGLVQGNSVSVERQGTSLVVRAAEQVNIKSIQRVAELRVSQDEPVAATVAKIANLYISGKDSILLNLTGHSATKRIEMGNRARDLFIGAEIVQENQSSLHLQFFLGNSDMTIQNTIKRLSSVSSMLLENSIVAFKISKKDLASSVNENLEAERFGYYLHRLILGSLAHRVFALSGDEKLTPDELGIYLLISRSFIEVCHIAQDIADLISKSDDFFSSEEQRLIGTMEESIVQSYVTAIQGLFEKDPKSASKVIGRSARFDKVESEVLSYLENSAGADFKKIAAIMSFTSDLRKVNELSRNVAELMLNLFQDKFVGEARVGDDEFIPATQPPVFAQIPTVSTAPKFVF